MGNRYSFINRTPAPLPLQPPVTPITLIRILYVLVYTIYLSNEEHRARRLELLNRGFGTRSFFLQFKSVIHVRVIYYGKKKIIIKSFCDNARQRFPVYNFLLITLIILFRV